MAAKPTTVPLWAYGGGAAITIPMGAKMALGWVVAEKPPAQYFNWQWNLVGQWCDYLNDIANHDMQWLIIQHFNFGAIFAQSTVNASAILAVGQGTGYGIVATGGANAAGMRGIGRGIGNAGVEGYGDMTVAAPGVRGVGGLNSNGGQFNGNGTGPGLIAIGGATGVGAVAQGSGGGAGLQATGNGSGVGVQAAGGATGHGIASAGGGTTDALRCLAGGIGIVDTSKQIYFTTPKAYSRYPTSLSFYPPTEWTPLPSCTGLTQTTAPLTGLSKRHTWFFAIPSGSVITGIAFHVAPPGGHGAIPIEPPQFTAVEYDPTTRVSSLVATRADTSATVMDYEVAHDVSATGLAHTIAPGTVVIMSVGGEAGGDANNGGIYSMPVITYTRSQIGEE